jgi:YVTN family beta-propeller protein
MSDDQPAQDPRERLAELFAQQQKRSPQPRGNQAEEPTSRGDQEMSARQPEEAQPAVGDPRERLAAMFEQRSRAQRPSGGPAQGPEAQAAEERTAVPTPEPVSSIPETHVGEIPADLRAQFREIDQRLSEAAARERRLGLLERQLARRQQELGAPPIAAPGGPAPRPPEVAGADSATPPALATRMEELDRRLAAVAAIEQRLARLEEQLAQRQPAAADPPPPHPASEPVVQDAPSPSIAPSDAADAPAEQVARNRRTRRLVWMILPLEALALALIIALGVSRRGVGQAPAAAPTPTVTAAVVATAQQAAAPTTVAPPSPVPTVGVSAAAAPTTAATPSPAATAVKRATPATPSAAPASLLSVASVVTIGQSLCDLAVDSSGQHVYVSDDGAEQLLALDLAQKQVKRFAMHSSLCSIALDQQRQTLYVPTWHRTAANAYDSSQVQAVDLATNAVQTFADGQFPTGPYFDAQKQTLYIGNTAAPSLFTINAATGTAGTITLPSIVNREATSSQNGDLYMASPTGNKVLVYDPSAGKVVATLSVGQTPWGVAADPKSGRVLVSSELSGSVSLIDPATNQIIRTTPTGSHPRNLAVDTANGRFYVLNTGDRTVSAIDADGRLLGTSEPMPGAEALSGIAVAAQTGQVFVVGKTHIYVLNAPAS